MRWFGPQRPAVEVGGAELVDRACRWRRETALRRRPAAGRRRRAGSRPGPAGPGVPTAGRRSAAVGPARPGGVAFACAARRTRRDRAARRPGARDALALGPRDVADHLRTAEAAPRTVPASAIERELVNDSVGSRPPAEAVHEPRVPRDGGVRGGRFARVRGRRRTAARRSWDHGASSGHSSVNGSEIQRRWLEQGRGPRRTGAPATSSPPSSATAIAKRAVAVGRGQQLRPRRMMEGRRPVTVGDERAPARVVEGRAPVGGRQVRPSRYTRLSRSSSRRART